MQAVHRFTLLAGSPTQEGVQRVGPFNKPSGDRFQRDVLVHVNAAYNLARWLVGNDHDAEDAVQDASVRAFRAYGSYRGGDTKAWYLAIVRNTSMNLIRSRNRRESHLAGDEDSLMNVPTRSPAPDEAVVKAYDAENLRRAIEALPAAWREMIILREFEQLSYKELAEVAAVPIGTVMSRLARARERLHDLLCVEEG